jgi:catechol 2,3-dioxygenase-like lactoylglutathione lyase family enzyme
MPTRVHVHLKVRDLAASRGFYERFFGEAPDKIKPTPLCANEPGSVASAAR